MFANAISIKTDYATDDRQNSSPMISFTILISYACFDQGNLNTQFTSLIDNSSFS